MREEESRWKVKRLLDLTGLEEIVIMNPGFIDPSLIYFTGITSASLESEILFIKRGKSILITNPLEYGNIKKILPKNIVLKVLGSRKDLKIVKQNIKGKVIGFNGSKLTYDAYRRLRKYKPKKMVDVSDQINQVKSVKNEHEIKRIKNAIRLTKETIVEIKKKIKPGITEKEVANMFEQIGMQKGAQGVAFDSKICFGKNGAVPHHDPDDTRLLKNDIVMMDVGLKVDNYCSDITRTFFFGEKNKVRNIKELSEMYNLVEKAQKEAIKLLKPGVDLKVPHKLALKIIEDADKGRYKGLFTHSLGHSFGLEIHEPPYLSVTAKGKLKEGNIVTVEPGIYVEGIGGIRIEDDILITKNGSIVL